MKSEQEYCIQLSLGKDTTGSYLAESSGIEEFAGR
jgi:hypothetical protein